MSQMPLSGRNRLSPGRKAASAAIMTKAIEATSYRVVGKGFMPHLHVLLIALYPLLSMCQVLNHGKSGSSLDDAAGPGVLPEAVENGS